MDARQDHFGQVLQLVQPATSRQFGSQYEPGQMVTFTSRSAAPDVDALPAVLVQIPWATWTDLGRPDEVTLAMTPGAVSLDVVAGIASSH